MWPTSHKFTSMTGFDKYLETTDLKDFFRKTILPRKGGGRDHISPAQYLARHFDDEIGEIKEKCSNGTYHFSAYNELLVLKSRGNAPRIISVPSVRDRFVLALLNSYLKKVYGIRQIPANRYIKDYLDFVEQNGIEGMRFLKTDISGFYDSVNHTVLTRILTDKTDGAALKLVMSAISTPTLADSEKHGDLNIKGVPQGLAISNTLAEIYVTALHNNLKKRFEDSLYLRYVDDILIITREEVNLRQIVENSIRRCSLGLSLSDNKTFYGNIETDRLDYIGYVIKGTNVVPKEANKKRFTDRLVRRCLQIATQYKDPALRPRFAQEDEAFKEFAVCDLNLMIAGFRLRNHNYGWLAYFQQLTDRNCLYELDALVKKKLGDAAQVMPGIISFVKAYRNLRSFKGEAVVENLDEHGTPAKKMAFLCKLGYSNEEEHLSDSEIEKRWNRLVSRLVKASEKDRGAVSA